MNEALPEYVAHRSMWRIDRPCPKLSAAVPDLAPP
jgi:hypothetical protein